MFNRSLQLIRYKYGRITRVIFRPRNTLTRMRYFDYEAIPVEGYHGIKWE